MDGLILNAGITAMIVGLAEAIKGVGMPHKYIPLIDIALGVCLSILSNIGSLNVITAIIEGIAYGLSACGLYSGTKNLIKKEDA